MLGERIAVIGNGGGGKTTLSRALGAALGLPHVEVDEIQFGPRWERVPADEVAAELEAQKQKRANFSRRRTHRDDADVTHINERNEHFNRKIERAFGEHTREIKANLERGTALPDH